MNTEEKALQESKPDLSASGETPGGTIGNDEDSGVALLQTKNLRRFRLIFTIGFLSIAIALAMGIYFLTRNQEDALFNAVFEDRAAKMIDTVHVRVEQKVGAVESFSFAVTSYASFNNLTWPFVTVPDYEVKAASIRSLANSVSLMFYAKVDSENRQAWELYSTEHREWVDQGLSFEKMISSQGAVNRLLQAKTDFISYIDNDGNRVPVEGVGPFYPAWQSSPVAENLINLDLHSTEVFSLGIDAVEETENAIVGASEDGSTLDETLAAFRDTWGSANSRFYDGEGPVNKIYFPVYNDLEPSRRNVVGMLTSVSFWDSFMDLALPPGQGNLNVVIKNKCGESYTYIVHGETVSYVGPGDQHDPDFTGMAITDQIFRLEEDENTHPDHNGIHLSDVCDYSMTLYPTQDLKDEYYSATPWFFFGLVLAVFIFTTIIIYVYDWKVEKNYQDTYKKAQQAGAIVSSIFPAAVRRRLYEEDDSNSNVKGTGAFKQAVPSAVDAQKIRLKGFLNEGAEGMTIPTDGLQQQDKDATPKLEKAIADLFPDTTILFADIVGFTAWSSQRYVLSVFS